MADSTTTGSAMAGCVPGGLVAGFGQRNSASTHMTDKVLFVYGSPQDVVTANVGSQFAYDLEGPDAYMAVAKGGSEWSRLGSLT